ncbi:hypothetical protein ACVWWJ_002680 [Luteibacter sp. HA06]
MSNEATLNLMKDGLEFVRNLIVTAVLIKLGGTIYVDPMMVGSEHDGHLVGGFLTAVGVAYGIVSTGYIALRHWPRTKAGKTFALVLLVASVVILEGTFTMAARVVDVDDARQRTSHLGIAAQTP